MKNQTTKIIFFSVAFLLTFFSLKAQVQETYQNDTLSLTRGDIVFLLKEDFKYIHRNPSSVFDKAVTGNKYKKGEILGFIKEGDQVEIIIHPIPESGYARLNYRINLFPALKEREISFSNPK